MFIKCSRKGLLRSLCLVVAATSGVAVPSLAQPPAPVPALETNQDDLVGIGALLNFERYTGSLHANPAGALRPILGAVIAGTPAATAELKAGDVILAIEGRNTAEMQEGAMIAALRGAVDTTVKLKIERRSTGGEPNHIVEPKVFEVTLPRHRVSLVPKASIGLTFQMVFLVQDMAPDSPAAKAGIKKGDVLLAINKKRIVMGADVRQAMLPVAPGQKIEVEFMRYNPATDKLETQRVTVETAPTEAQAKK